MTDVEVLAHKGCTAKFTIKAGTRDEMKATIAERLRSSPELSWKDTPEGINVAVILPTEIWKPRERFHLGKDDREKDHDV